MRKFNIVFFVPGKLEHVGTTYGQLSDVIKQFKGQNKLIVYNPNDAYSEKVIENLGTVIADTDSHVLTHQIPSDKWLLEFTGPHSKNSKLQNFKMLNKKVSDGGVLIVLFNLHNILAYAA